MLGFFKPAVKYYEKIRHDQAETEQLGVERAFNFMDMASKGLGAKIGSLVFRWLGFILSVLRAVWPIPRIGRLAMVTRYDDVKEVLDHHEVFEVPFGLEMTELAGGTNFVLGMQNGSDHSQMASQILGAIHASDIETIVKPFSARVAKALLDDCGGKTDVVRDLLTRVPTEVCGAYFGLRIDDPDGFAEWSMAVSKLLFGDPLGDETTRRLALAAGLRLGQVIDHSMALAKAAVPGSALANTLLGRLTTMQAAGTAGAPGPTDGAIRAMMMGLATGFVPTNTLASGHILEVLLDKDEAMRHARAAIATGDDKRLELCLFEALRFNAPLTPGPYRYAVRDYTLAAGHRRAKTIPAGTTVIVATQSAMFDSRKIDDPQAFRPDRPAADDLLFGSGLHWCLGAHLARAQITQTFKALLTQHDLKRMPGSAGKLQTVGPFPRHLWMTFEPKVGHFTQTLVTICAPIDDATSPADVRAALDALGNPAAPTIANALNGTRRVHFASMSVVEGETDLKDPSKREPSQLLLELVLDGPSESAIDAVIAAAGELLLPVFKTACGVQEKRDLPNFFANHTVELGAGFGGMYRLLSKSNPAGTTGLNFNGTPGQSVDTILKDSCVEQAVQNSVSAYLKSERRSGPTALDILTNAREQLRHDGLDWALYRGAGYDLLHAHNERTWSQFIKGILTDPSVVKPLSKVAAVFSLAVFGLGVWRHGWPATEFDSLPVSLWLWSMRIAAALAYGVLATVIATAAVAAIFYVALRRQEDRDQPADIDPQLDHVDEIMRRENSPTHLQNHVIAVTPMKPGLIREMSLAVSLWGIAKLVTLKYRPGFVIDLGTIHFARWFRLPRSNKLIFFSNYDGSWESYLEDFITKAHAGQTAVWSNGVGFPKSRQLINGGAEDGARFKRWVRRQQIPTRFWYSAYPLLTTDRVRTNAVIRDGLARARTDSDAQAWLDAIGSIPRPQEALETEEIQSLAFGGLGKLRAAEFVRVRFPERSECDQARAWLRDLGANNVIRYGDDDPAESAVMIGLSSTGLTCLGFTSVGQKRGTPESLASFPAAFVEDMASRSKILGDIGDNAPQEWQWGKADAPVDATLLLYGKDDETLATLKAQELKRLDAHGISFTSMRMQNLPARSKSGEATTGETGKDTTKVAGYLTEPFGFRDGVSQPIMRGTRRFRKGVNDIHVVAPGEFILGYPDDRKYYPPTPQVDALDDPMRLLPSTPENLPDRFPDFSSDHAAAPRDFGRNGSFLVIRQLEQDQAAFHDFAQRAVTEIAVNYPGMTVTPAWVEAKLVGRWHNGSSLVRNPSAPGTSADNDFLLGATDPQGFGCPFGSHTRRANPRDSFHPGSTDQIDISNRHRILRVGRPYVEGENTPATAANGLLFMCLNSDLERQFEFVQQTWMLAPSFNGLRNEVDPIVGAKRPAAQATFTIPTPTGPIILKNLEKFVRVRGGGYFFLPSRRALHFLAQERSTRPPAPIRRPQS